MDNAEIAARLRSCASRVRCLPPPNHRNPEVFHEARSEMGHELDNIANELSPREKRR
jgi:hypothetical protein